MPACQELAALLAQHRNRISASIDDLTAARDALDIIIATASAEAHQNSADERGDRASA